MEPEYPLTAIEVRPRAIGAVRAVRDHGRVTLASAASLPLPDGTISISMAQPNVPAPEAFRDALRSVLERCGIPRSGTVALVLPDPVARVSTIPASELAGKDASEIEDMIKFRLRKAVPFDVKEARVAYQMPATHAPEALAVAVVIARPVLESYESVLASVGLEAGLVELAGMAILNAVESSQPVGDRLIVNWDDGYVSLLLTRRGEPVLVRTLTGEAASTADDVARETVNTVLYYREKLGGAGLASVVMRSAVMPPTQAAELLRSALDTAPEILDPWARTGGEAAGAAGQAVAAAAACVVGKVQ